MKKRSKKTPFPISIDGGIVFIILEENYSAIREKVILTITGRPTREVRRGTSVDERAYIVRKTSAQRLIDSYCWLTFCRLRGVVT